MTPRFILFFSIIVIIIILDIHDILTYIILIKELCIIIVILRWHINTIVNYYHN